MDKIRETMDVYQGSADGFVEKYLTESVARQFGGKFYEALSGDRILDVGCGPGADSAVFADEGYDVTGFDLTPEFIRTARERVSEGLFVRGDMRQLPFHSNSFDGVWSCASFLHVPRPNAPSTLQEFRRVLDDDGAVYLSLKLGDGGEYDTNGRYFEFYTPEEVRSLLANVGFEPGSVTTHEGWVNAIAVK